MNVKEALEFCKSNNIKVSSTKRIPKNNGMVNCPSNFNFEVTVGNILCHRRSGGEACWNVEVDGKILEIDGYEYRGYKANVIYKAAELQLK